MMRRSLYRSARLLGWGGAMMRGPGALAARGVRVLMYRVIFRAIGRWP